MPYMPHAVSTRGECGWRSLAGSWRRWTQQMCACSRTSAIPDGAPFAEHNHSPVGRECERFFFRLSLKYGFHPIQRNSAVDCECLACGRAVFHDDQRPRGWAAHATWRRGHKGFCCEAQMATCDLISMHLQVRNWFMKS